jgi:hypothetical protein
LKLEYVEKTVKDNIPLFSILLLSVILRMLWINTPVARDEGNTGYRAMVWSRGYLPYSSFMASTNPPFAYIIYMLPVWFFGNQIMPIRLINDTLFWFSALALYLIAKDWYGKKAGLASAFFYGVFMNAPVFETQLAIPSSLSIPFIVFSIYFCSIYLRRKSRTALLVSGLLMSSASLIVQYQATGIILLSLMLIYQHRTLRKSKETSSHFTKDIITDSSVLALGVLLPILIASAYFWTYGVLNDVVRDVILRFFITPRASQGGVSLSLIFLIVTEALPLLLLSISGFVKSLFRTQKHDILLIAWTLLFIPTAFVLPIFGRHFAQMLPAASVLSGVCVVSILRDLKGNQRKTIGVFFTTVLLLSFASAIYFQSMQYPNTNFSLFGENFYYSFSSSFNEQQQIVDYIKSHSGNGSVLINSWDAELYWLSGQLAPGIQWTSSYPSTPEPRYNEEYQKILNSVTTGDYELVVLMTGFQPDAIMRAVPEKYFFVKNIGLYAIYNKYNAEGYSIEYSFIENLPQALQRYTLDNGTQGNITDLNNPIYLPIVEQLTINNESRTAIKQHPIAVLDSHTVYSDIIYNNISISPHSKLSFGIGIDPSVWNETDGVDFRILVQDDGGIHEMFSSFNDPAKNVGDRKWQDYVVDLNQFGNKSVSVYFVTDPGPTGNNAYDWAHWSNPLLLEGH